MWLVTVIVCWIEVDQLQCFAAARSAEQDTYFATKMACEQNARYGRLTIIEEFAKQGDRLIFLKTNCDKVWDEAT